MWSRIALPWELLSCGDACKTHLKQNGRVCFRYNLAEAYVGQEEATGEDYNVEEQDDGPRPFTVLLDTGLKRTSTGSKVFACLKVSNRGKRT